MQTKMNFLPIEKMCVGTIIKVSDRCNNIDAEIIYFRKITDKYKMNGNIFPQDELDTKIFDNVMQVYPCATKSNKLITTQEDIDDLKLYLQKQKELFEITITYNSINFKVNKCYERYLIKVPVYIEDSFMGNNKFLKTGNIDYCLSPTNGIDAVNLLDEQFSNTFLTLEEICS